MWCIVFTCYCRYNIGCENSLRCRGEVQTISKDPLDYNYISTLPVQVNEVFIWCQTSLGCVCTCNTEAARELKLKLMAVEVVWLRQNEDWTKPYFPASCFLHWPACEETKHTTPIPLCENIVVNMEKQHGKSMKQRDFSFVLACKWSREYVQLHSCATGGVWHVLDCTIWEHGPHW